MLSVKKFFGVLHTFIENSQSGTFEYNKVTRKEEWVPEEETINGKKVPIISETTLRISVSREDMMTNGFDDSHFPVSIDAESIVKLVAPFDVGFSEGVEYQLRPSSIALSLDKLWIKASYASPNSAKSAEMQAKGVIPKL
tara:strand:- start:6 stop:425 length:420 start_codon:yes stop_codon:yes gene_type:complete